VTGRQLLSLSLDEVIKETKLMDRVEELSNVISRAQAKLDALKSGKSSKVVSLPSPLRIVKLYVRGSKRRPKWTYS